jgi:hypothetical protein
MIIDEISIDPRRILQATIDSVGIGWRLVVNLLYGESIQAIESFHHNKEDALAALAKIDEKAYRGALADAIASDRLIDGSDDDAEKNRIGFRTKE